MKKIFFGLLGLTLISILFAACRVVDADTLPKNPKVTMGSSVFTTPSVTIHKGDKLDLVNTSSNTHTLLNGQWKGTTQDKTTEAGAPTVNGSTQPGQTLTVGPFNTAGTFHIYCDIHQGMNLVVIVQ
ncbi:MAG TPA: plastocyanin/azurin family copper-binding protein [Dictyobacter sp.]|jgi:plastocyanin|nr:plastocyanin/azurin family copper-binding protein [Dictyobacter sp.]